MESIYGLSEEKKSTVKTQGKKMYKKETSKQRKFRETREPLNLVGFGKLKIEEVLDLIGTKDEALALFAPRLIGPTVWRKFALCSEQEREDASTYVEWVDETLVQLHNDDLKKEEKRE